MVRKSKKKIEFRSGLEDQVIFDLRERKINYEYEYAKVKYTVPESVHNYTPDLWLLKKIGCLDPWMKIEIKGRLTQYDRMKHELIKKQLPNLDIRFIFGNANNKIYRTKKGVTRKRKNPTYAEWSEGLGYKWAEKYFPQAWVEELA